MIGARWIAAAWLVASALLGGCAVAPRTTVVLMPDEDGHVGAVSISSGSESRRIDQAFDVVTVEGTTAAPSASTALGRDAVGKAYADLLDAQPTPPRRFILHFVLDSTTLTEESKALLPLVIDTARQRKPTEITVFGHADSSGTDKRNLKLSAERARIVAALLRRSDPSLDIEVQFFGDKVPLVPSDSRAPEPRNRRAEISIL